MATEWLARAPQGAPYNSDPNPTQGRSFLQGLSGHVELHEVRVTRRIDHSGHVYNLQTGSGWYQANGYIVHNCLCYITQHVVPEDEFIDKLLAGDYDEHLGHQAKEDPPKKDPALAFLDAHAKDPANSTASLVNQLVGNFGVRRDDAKAMVATYRPSKGRSSRAKPPKTTVVPLDPEQRPANPGAGVPKQGQHTGSVEPATSVPTSTPDTPAPPSQPPLLVRAHLQRINKIGNAKAKVRVQKALERQASFTPKTALRLHEVAEMDRRAPSFGEAGVVGEYDHRQAIMFLHPSAFLPQAGKVFEHEKKTNYISKCGQQFDSLDNLIAHEYGHHVHDRWLASAPLKVKTKVVKDLCNALGIAPPLHFDDASLIRWSTKNKIGIANRVSRYGSTNILEMMAEIWAEYTLGDPPRSYMRDAGEVLQQTAEEYS